MNKRKRVNITLKQKLDVIQKLESGISVSRICEEYGIKKQTVSDIKKSKNKIKTFMLISDEGTSTNFRKHMKVAREKQESLEKCRDVLIIRKQNNLKYKDILLPSEVSYWKGYHRKCYKYFTTLINEYGKNVKSKKEDSVTIPTSFSPSQLSTKSSDENVVSTEVEQMREKIKPPISEELSHITCFFCDKRVKKYRLKIQPLHCKNKIVFENNLKKYLVFYKNHEFLQKLQSLTTEEVFFHNSCQDFNIKSLEKIQSSIKRSHHAICFFCDKNVKKFNGQLQPLHYGEKKIIANYIEKFLPAPQNYKLLQNLKNLTEKIHYHDICKHDYYNRYKTSIQVTNNTFTSSKHSYRSYHKIAYEEICLFIEEYIIIKRRCFLLSYLHQIYMNFLMKKAQENSEVYNTRFTQYNLELKIKNTFDEIINVVNLNGKKVVVPKAKINLIQNKRSAENELEDEISNKITRFEDSPSTSETDLVTNIKTEEKDLTDPLSNDPFDTSINENRISNDPFDTSINGNRITSIKYYFDELKKLASHNLEKGCTFLHLTILSEELNGLNSKLIVRCENCMDDFKVPLTNPSVPKNVNLNKNIVSKDIDNSLGYAGLKIIFDSVDVPIMEEEQYKEMLKTNSSIENQVFIKEEPFDIKTDFDDF